MMRTMLRPALPLLVLWAIGAWPAASLAQPEARADEGWRVCASEGQTCRVERRTVVRYGADTRWSSRVVAGSVDCTNEAFGDPAPQVPKQCQVRDFAGGGGGGGGGGGAAAGWTFCAAEGEMCNFRGQSEVRFGADDRFTVRSAYERVRCGVEDFGDPVYGVTKHCEVRSAAALPAGPQRPGWAAPKPAVAWRYCAAEGQNCEVRGRTQVRFGDGRRYTTRNVDGQIACSVSAFGDPSYGVLKHCEVLVSGYPTSPAVGWTRCAAEGQRCAFSGQAQVRYGSGGRYVYREAYNGLDCASVAFGNDPYPGKVKGCEIRR